MKYLDKVLRNWRVREGIRYVRNQDKVLDIGCFDGYMFKKLKSKNIQPSIGIDPLLKKATPQGIHTLMPGLFPEAVPDNTKFDSIVMLAVLEHIPREEQKKYNQYFLDLLNPSGRVIITVPSPFVDTILDILTKLRLIDGMSLDEHFGFEIKEVHTLLDNDKFRLLKHKKFQLGLNNLFVFERI